MGYKLPVLSAVLGILLTGCAQRYTVRLTNGNTITTRSKPRLNAERSAFIFKGPTGQEMVIPTGRVTEIAPME